MAILFLLSSIVSSLVQPIEPKSCESLMDMFETARSYFYNENYIEAYRLFYELEYTYNIKRTQSAWFQIQCFIRLGHWRQAIDKCHELQQLEPTMSHWYMIASDIYTDRSEFSLAWEELNQATLKTRDDAYAEICSNKRMLQEGKHLGIIRTDILNHSLLPYEIRCDIFKRLDLASLTKCTAVSKRWRSFLISNGFLWNELYFDNKKKSVKLDMDTLHWYLEKAKRVSKVSVRYQQTDGDGILMALAKFECYKLHTLVLSDIICTPGLFFNVLEYVGSTLKKLQWGGVSIRLNDLIDNIPKLCKQLTELTIHDCFTSLHDAQLISGTLNRLEYFGEGFCPVFLNSVKTLTKLNDLQQLELNGIHGLTASHLANILLRCPGLVQLILKRCLVNIIPVLNILRVSCPKLQYFEYERNRYNQNN